MLLLVSPGNFIFYYLYKYSNIIDQEDFNFIYLKPTEACQAKANKKNKTGIAGKTLTKG